MKIGKVYKTVGGWDAKIIWICSNDPQTGFYAIHKPKTPDESVPIYHWSDGSAHSSFSVNEPPRYGSHPADIVLRRKKSK